jgi:microcystin-dependent protein
MATINYENKEALNVNPTIPNKNKVVDSDMNLIKQVGNQILTTMGVYTDTWSSSATYNVDEITIYDNRIFKNLTGTNTATTPDLDTTNWEETTLASMSGGGGATGDTLPIGAIVPYGSATAPTNWLVCDGSAVSRTTYSELFAVIGTTFGSGDGSTTFNLPNLKGRVPVGYNGSDNSFKPIGKTGGEKTHTLTIDEMPSHTHAPNNRATTFAGTGTNNPGQTAGDRSWENLSIGNTGGGQAHNNLQPYQTVNYIIKATQSAGLVANVSNIQSNSTTDTYSCDYINGIKNTIDNTYGRHILYTSSGGTSSTITLSESSSYYSYLEIYYYADAHHDSVKIPTSAPNFSLNLLYTDVNNHRQYIYTTDCSLSGNQITQNVARNNFITSDNTISSYGNTPYIKVYKVIGYK